MVGDNMDMNEFRDLVTGEDPRAYQMGGDLYTSIASLWLGKNAEEVTPEERNVVKVNAFPFMYGRGRSL